MAENYTGESQPTDGAAAKFLGARADTGAAGEFLAVAGDEVVTEEGKRVVSLRVNQPSTSGLGLATGTKEDAAATTNTGTFSLIALIKHALEHLTTIINWVAAIGATTDTAAEGDTNGSVIAKARGVTKVLGTVADAKNIDSTTQGTLNARMRGVIEFLEFIKAVVGLTSDVSLAADQSGTINAHTRSLTKYTGDTDDTAVTTDANGTLSAKLRGLIVLFVNLLTRWPAALGPAASGSSLAITQAANTAVLATAVTVGVTATALPASALANRRTLTYFNNGTVTTYVGSAAVTTASGIPVGPGQSYSIDLGPGVTLYAISGTAAQNGRVVEAA